MPWSICIYGKRYAKPKSECIRISTSSFQCNSVQKRLVHFCTRLKSFIGNPSGIVQPAIIQSTPDTFYTVSIGELSVTNAVKRSIPFRDKIISLMWEECLVKNPKARIA